MFDLISLGDSTIDNFVQIHDAQVKCNLDKTKCMLCVEYGDKIPVDKLTHLVAGNAANAAVGASRLKLSSSIYTNVGSDLAGKQIIEKLKNEGVNTRYVLTHEGMESNLSTVLTFQGERTIFVYHQDWKYKLPDLDQARWVYFTSIAPTFTDSNLLNELTVYLERTGCKLLYSPGTYQIKYGVKKNPKLLNLTEVFIVNCEEAKRILGHNDDEDIPIKKLLKEICNLGPKMAIITDGANGSYGYESENFYNSSEARISSSAYHIKAFPAKLMEMTGAGDAYATGLLAGLFYGKNLMEAMRWGAANGAAVVEEIGPQAGLLTYSKMQERLKDNSKIIAKEI